MLTDEHLAEARRVGKPGSSPAPGWPLPGHVMATPTDGPGTEVWKELGLDQYDW